MVASNPYSVGSITLTNSVATFTGTGTAWATYGIGDGCTLRINSLGLDATIDSITDNFNGTLKQAWPGASGTYAVDDYEIWYPTQLQEQAATAAKVTGYIATILGAGTLVDVNDVPLPPDA